MKSLKLCTILTILILLTTLFFGLRPKGFNLSNNVKWLKDYPGIRFSKYGIAYTILGKDFIERRPHSDENNFSMMISFRPESLDQNGFNHILSVHDGKDKDQLLIGQWRSYIIVMNGDDYANKRKIKRITYKIESKHPQKMLLTVTSSENGTALYMDDQIVKSRKDLHLRFPKGERSILTLGNSVYGKHSWKGEVYELFIYKNELTPEEIKHNLKNMLTEDEHFLKRSENATIAYYFDEKEGGKVVDHGEGSFNLIIPYRMKVLDKRILPMPWVDLEINRTFLLDFFVNLLGFIPLGFFLCATFISFGGVFQGRALIITVVFCFLTSLGIEFFQAWIPSRSSHSLDLMLNTIGGFIGGVIGSREGRRLLG